MYKILIVDDEALIRESLAKRLTKGDFFFQEILESASGEEALNIIQNEHPQIIITDVRMDGMSGIELIKACSIIDPFPYFIVLSGYAEFEYVQQAINNGAEGYLLKPITNEKLFDAIHKGIDSVKTTHFISSMQEEHSILTFTHLFQKCMDDIISEEDIKTMISLLHEEKKQYYRLGLFHVSKFNQNVYSNIESLYKKLESVLSSASDFSFRIISLGMKAERYILFFSSYKDVLDHHVLSILQHFTGKENLSGNTVTTGLSRITTNIDAMLRKDCEKRIQLRYTLGNEKVYSDEPIDLPSTPMNPISRLDFENLEKQLRSQNMKEISNTLTTLISHSSHIFYSMELFVHQIYLLLIRLDFCVDEQQWSQFFEAKQWRFCEDKEEIITFVLQEIQNSFTYCSNENDSQNILEYAKIFIKGNFSDNLTLKIMADQFHLNPRYFSSIFKKKFGMSPIDYLLQTRMDEAKYLLSHTLLPASEIASTIGYDDPRHFYKTFKKNVGITPKEFREKCKETK
ncbi:helix-turn-helix domain-containing protein [Robinsoniella peoriensis]|uniref:helix-turn-helix domain-containing protein n=1 Tax=Robinsoniella peoriensis TaxID=180332 RepID=UPI0036285626